MSTSNKLLLRTSSVLWIIWGLVHILAGVLTISGEASNTAISGIADAVDPATLKMVYPAAVDAILNQHGFNLLWIGLTTFVGAFYIWRESAAAIFIVALVGGLADIGYFIFLDLGGFVRFLPGTLMTLFSCVAIILSFIAYYRIQKINKN
jgi:hypothetical protein